MTTLVELAKRRKARAAIDALCFTLEQHAYDMPDAIKDVLKDITNRLSTDVRNQVEYARVYFEIQACLSLIEQRIATERCKYSELKRQWDTVTTKLATLQHLKIKSWDRMIALQTRQTNFIAYCNKHCVVDTTERSNELITYVHQCLQQNIGLMRYINHGQVDVSELSSSPWFQALKTAEQAYFSNLIKRANTVLADLDNMQTDTLRNLNREQFMTLVELVYPFSAGFTNAPVIANPACQQFDFNDDGDLDEVIKCDDLLPLGLPEDSDPRIHFKFARIGLPDQGKAGSREDKRQIVEDIVAQAMLAHETDNQARYRSTRKQWGLATDELIPQRVHCTISLIDDKQDFFGKGPSDTLYHDAVDKHCRDKKLTHVFTRFAINATREYASADSHLAAFKQQKKFYRLAKSAFQPISSSIHAETKHYKLLQYALESYKDIAEKLYRKGTSWSQGFVDRDTINLQLRLVVMQIIICHSLGWSYFVNCKSSKDRTGLVAACAAAEISTFLKHQRFSPAIYTARGTTAPTIEREETDILATYHRTYRTAYLKQIQLSNKMSPGAAGLKNSENLETKLKCAVIPNFVIRAVTLPILVVVKSLGITARAVYRNPMRLAVSPFILAYAALTSSVVGLRRLIRPKDYTQTPAQEQAAIDGDGPECHLHQAIRTELTADTDTHDAADRDDSQRPLFKQLKTSAKLNKFKSTMGWRIFHVRTQARCERNQRDRIIPNRVDDHPTPAARSIDGVGDETRPLLDARGLHHV